MVYSQKVPYKHKLSGSKIVFQNTYKSLKGANQMTHNLSPQALNAALREAVDFIHAEGWDRPATLFALVPHEILADAIDFSSDATAQHNPYALVVQEDLPEHIRPGSEELGEFIATIRWPDMVQGAILAQEIIFHNSAEGADPSPRAARLYSGILHEGPEQTFIQLRPTEEELEADPFAQDKVELLGGDNIAPGVIATLRQTFEV